MKLVTGNDLISGLVVWWTGRDWSRFIADAVDAGSEGDAIVAREEAAQNVNTAYVIDATLGEHGPVPLNVKQSIRAFGPSVHPQFAPDVFHPPFVSSEVETRSVEQRPATSLETNGRFS